MNNRHPLLPIIFDGWDGDMEVMTLYDVFFTDDFGPFHKNEKLSNLTVNFEKAEISQHDDQGKIIRTVKVRLVPS